MRASPDDHSLVSYQERAADSVASITVEEITGLAGFDLSAVALLHDLTNRQHEQHLAALGQLAALIESANDAIIGMAADGTITSWNHRADLLYGYAATDILGQSIAMIIPAERLRETDSVREHLRRGERSEPFETVRLRRDGQRIDV